MLTCCKALRERIKVKRGWKNPASKVAEGQRLRYSFVKPHVALDGQTPAESARIGVNAKDKWGGPYIGKRHRKEGGSIELSYQDIRVLSVLGLLGVGTLFMGLTTSMSCPPAAAAECTLQLFWIDTFVPILIIVFSTIGLAFSSRKSKTTPSEAHR